MSNLTIGKKTNLAILTSFTLIAIIGVSLYLNLSHFISTQAWVKHTNHVTANVTKLVGALVDMETGVRGFAVGGDEQFLEPFNGGKEAFTKVMAETQKLVSDNPAQVTRLKKLAEAAATWLTTDVEPTLKLRRQAGSDTAKLGEFVTDFNQAKGKAQMDAMRALAKEIIDVELVLLDRREQAFAEAATTSKLLISLGLPLSMILGLSLLVWAVNGAVKSITRIAASLNAGADQFTSSSNEVSRSSQTLARGSSEQAASLEEISSSIEELASMTKRNAENANSGKTASGLAHAAAEAGAAEMERMQAAMNSIQQSSNDISKIIKTIDEIAFQTNILALNAAVEAARAGEAGAGFAVVADEVRSLAQRSAVAAKETADKIADATSRSAQGVDLSVRVAAGLKLILEKSREVDRLVSEVATASNEQSEGITQINSAVGQMDKVTQSNAANAEETAAAAEELSAQSDELRLATTELSALVGAKSESSVRHAVLPEPPPRSEEHNATASTVTTVKHGRARRDLPTSDGTHGRSEELSFRD